uniref:Uncharacterized protein n=2 Tax=Plectus sambesii TaxID=2011161 RepID=A0A914XK15_9BILA
MGKTLEVQYPPTCQPIGPSHSNNELVRRLRLLANALQEADQDAPTADKYKGLAIHLAQPKMLENSSREVRVLLACCIADLFRIFAPDAPYGDPSQLKDVLLFLIRTLRGLDNPNDPQFRRYYYLLENLALVKTLQMALELGDDAQGVLKQLIKCAFSVVKPGEEHESKIQSLLMDIIVPLIQGVDQISPVVLDAVFYFIVNPQKTQNCEAYNMAKDLLQRCQTSFEPCVQVFFNQALLTGSLPESELVGQNKMYDLIYELYEIVPDMLYSVLPQLEYKFHTENDKERLLVVDLVGRLFHAPKSTVAEDNPTLWNGYLGRFNDRKFEIRLRCVEHAQFLLVNQPALRGQVSEALMQRSHDTEESIRLAVVVAITAAAKKKFESVNDRLFENLAERARDKKPKVRREALLNLGTLYRKVLCSDEFSDSERNSLKWVRSKILYVYYQQSLEDRLLVEKLVCSCLVPYNLEAERRMTVLFETYCSLDENACKAFNQIIRQQSNVRTLVRQLLELHKGEENSERDSQIAAKLRKLADCHADPARCLESLKRFYEFVSADQRALQLLEYIVGTSYTTKKVEDAVKEIFGKFGADANVKTLLERTAPLMIDTDAIEVLVERVRNCVIKGDANVGATNDSAVDSGLKLLLVLSESFPYTFRCEKTMNMLIELLKFDHPFAGEVAIQVFANIGPDSDHKFDGIYGSLMPELCDIAKNGTPRQAKYAVRCIAKLSEAPTDIFRQIIDSVEPNVQLDHPKATTALKALGAIADIAPLAFRADMKKLIKDAIVSDIVLSAGSHDDDERHVKSWVAAEDLSPQCAAKVAGIKFMVRYLVGVKTNDDSMVSKTLKMLSAIVEAKGDIHYDNKISEAEKSYMRLTAGVCVLKLAEEAAFCPLISHEYFQVVAELISDECAEVRQRFALRLHKGLSLIRLPIEYMAMFSLAPLFKGEGHKTFRNQIRNCVNINVTKRRELLRKRPDLQQRLPYYMPEYCMAYAVHLLAHNKRLRRHDDIGALSELKECLWLLLEVFWSLKDQANNFQFLYRLFQDIKDSVDKQKAADEAAAQEQNKKMWALCDVSMLLLVYRVNVVIKDTPAKSVLSTRYFERHQSNTTVYVPAEVMDDEKRKFGKHRPTVASIKDESKLSTTARGKKRRASSKYPKVIDEVPAKQVKREDSARQQPRRTAKSDVKIERDESDDDDDDDDDDDSASSPSVASPRRSVRAVDDEPATPTKPVRGGRRTKNDSSVASAAASSPKTSKAATTPKRGRSSRASKVVVNGKSTADDSDSDSDDEPLAPASPKKSRDTSKSPKKSRDSSQSPQKSRGSSQSPKKSRGPSPSPKKGVGKKAANGASTPKSPRQPTKSATPVKTAPARKTATLAKSPPKKQAKSDAETKRKAVKSSAVAAKKLSASPAQKRTLRKRK